MYIKESIEIGGKTLSIETGKMAKQADGAVVVRYGDSMVLVTAVANEAARDIERLREIQRLSGEGIGLTGVRRILDLERLADELTARVRELEEELETARRALVQLQQHATSGNEVALRDRAAVVVWRRPTPSI